MKNYTSKIVTETTVQNNSFKPVHPVQFRDNLKKRLLDLQPTFKFSHAMNSAFETYCSVFNDIVRFNVSGDKPKRLAIPAPTGSAKSVGSQVYFAMLSEVGGTGLLVVSKIKEAVAAVKAINGLAGKKVAVCSYSISKDNPNCPERCEAKDLHKHQIVVISHKMFTTKSRFTSSLNKYKLYKNNQRECIIIDEKISFEETIFFTTKQVKSLSGYVKGIAAWNAVEEAITLLRTCSPKQSFKKLRLHKLLPEMRKALNHIVNGDGFVGNEIDRDLHPEADKSRRAAVAHILDEMIYVVNGSNQRITGGDNLRIARTEDITNRFGSVAILDATLRQDMVLTAHGINRQDTILVHLPDNIRSYKNATLHVCKDVTRVQSRDFQLTKHSKKRDRERLIDEYLLELNVIAGNDKLLVVVFKDLEEAFVSRCGNSNIKFIHYGEHDARNDLVDHGKVCCIGYNRLHVDTFMDVIAGVKPDMSNYISIGESPESDAQAMVSGTIITSIVQAFNRSWARICSSTKGDCRLVDWYLFDDGKVPCLVEELTYALPGVKVEPWKPARASSTQKLSKVTSRNIRIVKWLASGKQGKNVMLKEVADHFNITEATIKLAMKQDKSFREMMDENDIQFITKKGRYGGSYFVVPESSFERVFMSKSETVKITL